MKYLIIFTLVLFSGCSTPLIAPDALKIEEGAVRNELVVPEKLLVPIEHAANYGTDMLERMIKYAVDEGVRAGSAEVKTFSENADRRMGQFVPPVWIALGMAALTMAITTIAVFVGIRRVSAAAERYTAIFEKDKLSEIHLQEARFSKLEQAVGCVPETSEENGAGDTVEG